MIGLAPPLPQFRNLPEYVAAVEHELGRELSRDEIEIVAAARSSKATIFQCSEFLAAVKASMDLSRFFEDK